MSAAVPVPPPVGAAPPVPDSSLSEPTFDAQFEAFLAWLKDDAQVNINANVANAFANAGAAFDSATTAVAAAVNALAYSLTAVNAPGTKATSTSPHSMSTGSKVFAIQTGKSIAVGQTMVAARTSDPVNTRLYGVVSAEDSVAGSVTLEVVGFTGVGGPYSDWTISLGVNVVPTTAAQDMSITTRGTVSMLVAADKGKYFDLTGGITQTLDAAASLGAGWWCEIGSGDNTTITVDANASELIDGALTLAVLPGYRYRLICTGTAFKTRITKRRVYGKHAIATTTQNITMGPDTFVFRGYAVGNGGSATASARGAGGGMAYGDIAVQPGGVITINITAGVAKVIYDGVDMLTANPASGVTAGTASKHASVTNGGAYSGGAGSASAGGGSSSGSPLGVGVVATSAGGAGWGGTGGSGGGGGTGGAGTTGLMGGPSISRDTPALDPLLAICDGAQGVYVNASGSAGDGSHGGRGAGGGFSGSGTRAGDGGIGAGGGAANGAGRPGDGGFGGGGGSNTGASHSAQGGYGGGAGSSSGGTTTSKGAAVLYFTGEN